MQKFFFFILIMILSACSGKTRDELYAEGVAQLAKGNANGAIVLLKNALEKDQAFKDARYQLGLAYLKAGKLEQAERELSRVLKENPGQKGLHLEMARLYNSMKKPEQARAMVDVFVKATGPSAEALGVLGDSYALENNLSQAERYLLQSLQLDPGGAGVKTALAGIYLTQGKILEARRKLDEILTADAGNVRALYLLAALENNQENPDRAIQLYQQVSSIDKTDAVAPYKMGLIYLDKGDFEKAEKLAAFLTKTFPERGEGTRLKGLVQYSAKNFPEAITLLQESLKKQPSLEAWYFLGLSLYNRGELENALSQFRKILDYNPAMIQARVLTSMILLKQRRADDAIGEIKKVLQVDGNNAFARNVLGSGYMAKGMFEEGMKELKRATELDSRIVDAHLKQGLFNLSSGRMSEAETDLKTALQVAPDVLSTRLVLAAYYQRRGDWQKASATLKGGLAGHKSDAVFYNALAQVAFAQGKSDEGLGCLSTAKQLDPGYLPTYLNVADHFTMQGDYGKALSEYLTVLEREPANLKVLLGAASLCEMAGQEKEAYTYYNKAKEGGTPTAYLAFAAFHLKRNEAGNALALIEEGLKRHPSDIVLLELKGRTLLEQRKYRDAIRVFEELEISDPQQSYSMRIIALLKTKDYRKAKQLAEQARDRDAGSAFGSIMLATVHESQGNTNAAISELKKGTACQRQGCEALMMLGNLYARQKNTVAAMAAFVEAARKQPDHAPAWYAQGVLLEQSGKKKEAAAKYRQALENAPEFVAALNNLACLYADGHGSPSEAARLAMAAYRQQPANPAVMETLGYVLLKNGRKAQALELLQKAAERLPDSATSQYHLALALSENGQGQQAQLKLKKALHLGKFPEEDYAKHLLAKLSRSEKRN